MAFSVWQFVSKQINSYKSIRSCDGWYGGWVVVDMAVGWRLGALLSECYDHRHPWLSQVPRCGLVCFRVFGCLLYFKTQREVAYLQLGAPPHAHACG